MLRGFTDSTGVEWRVWEVFPTTTSNPGSADSFSRTSLKDSPFENGWLCFESSGTKRRLAPIPAGWELSSASDLDELCRAASAVPLRRVPGGDGSRDTNAAPGAP